MKLRVTVKSGQQTLAQIDGREVDPVSSELERVIFLEQILERLTGHRWHFDQVSNVALDSGEQQGGAR
jgi:hypothetical protein